MKAPTASMTIHAQAKQIARLLERHRLKVVFAESCTGGLAAGSLARIPGISEHLCGGMVTYRNPTKTQYLGISPAILKKPGPVSSQVAALMAEKVLQKTPEADVAAAVTGHLGPNAPPPLDGQVFLAVARRRSKARTQRPEVHVKSFQCPPGTSRRVRQDRAVVELMMYLADVISSATLPAST
jgi:PncC family amidohydrolase